MKAMGILLGVAAYTLGSWGFLLVKGYNVTLGQWVTPLHPFDQPWPPKCVPPGYIFPTSKAAGVDCKQPAAAGTGSNDPAVKRAQRAMQESHRPGGVPGRL